MTLPGRDYSWLPEHQLHAAYTLAHVDTLIARAGDVLLDYLDPGPFTLENIVDSQAVTVQVKAVAPLPAAAARYTADAMTQMRAVIEHTIFLKSSIFSAAASPRMKQK